VGNDESDPAAWRIGWNDGLSGQSSAPPTGFDSLSYGAGYAAGRERRQREIALEPARFLYAVLHDEQTATPDRIAAAVALMQHGRLADLDL
jgi:hypothetical protein